ncbi:MAG TPA: hypothetical protein VF669_01240 [Tepidisphaeraceae bacterium]|jgi:hypothetical protein
MGTRSVSLDEKHYQAAEERARQLGTTPQQYLQGLIEHDNETFDQILTDTRRGFENLDDAALDELFDKAQKYARQQRDASKS